MSQADINMSQLDRTFTLIGRSGESYQSSVRGILGGHRGNKIYGRLERGGIVQSGIYEMPE